MNPGKLNRKITIQQQSSSKSTRGSQVETWTALLATNGGIETLTGKEFKQGNAEQAEVTHKFRMRYYSTVKPNMRVLYCTRTFEIMYIINLNEQNKELHLFCKELFVDG